MGPDSFVKARSGRQRYANTSRGFLIEITAAPLPANMPLHPTEKITVTGTTIRRVGIEEVARGWMIRSATSKAFHENPPFDGCALGRTRTCDFRFRRPDGVPVATSARKRSKTHKNDCKALIQTGFWSYEACGLSLSHSAPSSRGRHRTCNVPRNRRTDYQLSYSGIDRIKKIVINYFDENFRKQRRKDV
jgi:hypothetical protein